MVEPYPSWKKGVRRGFKWGLIVSALLTLPNLFLPIGDPIPGAPLGPIIRHQLVEPLFWLNILGIFGSIFVVVFLLTALLGAFRPD